MSELGRVMMQNKLIGIVQVTECQGDWFKGRFSQDIKVTLEWSFEPGPVNGVIPGTYITYLGAWRPVRGMKIPSRTLVEVQLGVVCVAPDISTFTILIQPFLERLKGFRPIRVASDAI